MIIFNYLNQNSYFQKKEEINFGIKYFNFSRHNVKPTNPNEIKTNWILHVCM